MLVAGVLVGLALTVLLFWVMLREAVYLLYTVTLSLQTLSLLYLSGEGYAMPVLRQLAPLGTYGVWIVSVLAMVSATMLLLAYAGMRWRVPRISQAMRWLGIYLPMLLLLLQALPWLQAKGWLPNASNALFVASSALGIVGLYAAWRKGGRHAGILLIAWVPMVLFIAARTVQLESQRPMPGWMEYGMPLMLAFTGVVMALGLADRTLTMRRERDSAKEHAERDYLTGVLNRGGIEYRLDWAIINTRREGLPLSVLFMDIDHFKRVNDHHGHGVGDSCLRAVVRAISEELHYGDQLGRLGGEEFVLGLPGADGEDALQTAERLRRKIESNCREVEGAPVYITVSIGVAESNPADTVASLIRRADQAMYAAKHAGRNRVV
ncbi:sensor domain-containing diguanylate cyclase [Pseudoxanthomonas kalamensis]|uniref:sensor domain-containing diguanylate cyclase n=1 Tax=Pseudoxanthomonas kalamensis TaxID=289483 RepID=UPI001391C22A|nr:GGDEF domain-containing protein [Pseudoxanthomonas kalamensis]